MLSTVIVYLIMFCELPIGIIFFVLRQAITAMLRLWRRQPKTNL